MRESSVLGAPAPPLFVARVVDLSNESVLDSMGGDTSSTTVPMVIIPT